MIAHEIGGAWLAGTHVADSLSPTLHKAAYEAMGLDWGYEAHTLPILPAGPDRQAMFDAFLRERALDQTAGGSVTKPFKFDALSSDHVAEGSPKVQLIGSANTLSHPADGIWTPDNTDGIGALAALQEIGVDVEDRQVVVIGAGGTTPAVVYELAEKGAQTVIVANRTISKADRLTQKFTAAFPETRFVPTALHRLNMPTAMNSWMLEKAEVIINTSSIGHNGTEGEGQTPLSEDAIGRLPEGAAVLDAVYMPIATPLLESISRVRPDILTRDGTRMLLRQAVEQVAIFAERDDVPVEVMDQAMQKELTRRAT